MKKLCVSAAFVAALVLALAAPAVAHDCTNLSKNIDSVSVVIGQGCNPDHSDQITVLSNGLAQRVDKFGLAADGSPNFPFAGPVGIDVNCDGTADFTSYQPGGGTGGVVPGAVNGKGQDAVKNCKGLTNVETAFEAGCPLGF